MAREDFLLDDSGDLKWPLERGASDNQHAALAFEAFKGEVRTMPSLGFGALQYVKSGTSPLVLKSRLKSELKRDGYKQPKVGVSQNGELNIEVR